MGWRKNALIATGVVASAAGLCGGGAIAESHFNQPASVNTTIATATARRVATPTVNSAAGSNGDPKGYQLMNDYELSHGQCMTVNEGSNVVTLVEGDVNVGPVGTPYSSLRRAFDSKQQTGLIVEATGPVEVCAPYGADVQVVGSDLDAVGYFEGQDIEGFKANGCGLPNGCSVVDVIKATNGVLTATQGN